MITGLILLWNLVGFSTSWIARKRLKKYLADTRKDLALAFFAVEGLEPDRSGLLSHHKTQKWYFKVTWPLGTLSHTFYTLYLWR